MLAVSKLPEHVLCNHGLDSWEASTLFQMSRDHAMRKILEDGMFKTTVASVEGVDMTCA